MCAKPTAKELDITAVVALEIEKRFGEGCTAAAPKDNPEDYTLPVWRRRAADRRAKRSSRWMTESCWKTSGCPITSPPTKDRAFVSPARGQGWKGVKTRKMGENGKFGLQQLPRSEGKKNERRITD